MRCDYCGEYVVDNANFCGNCGKSLESNGPSGPLKCPQCGFDVPKGFAICGNCAYHLPEEEIRRFHRKRLRSGVMCPNCRVEMEPGSLTMNAFPNLTMPPYLSWRDPLDQDYVLNRSELAGYRCPKCGLMITFP